MKSTKNIIEKDALIRSNTMQAYHEFIDNENYQYYADALEVAEAAMMELNGYHHARQHELAAKYAMLQMLRKNLI